MKHSNFAMRGRFRLLVRGEQRDPGISFANESRHAVPHAIMKSLEPEDVDVPLGRSFDVAHPHGYVINTFELHEILDRMYRIYRIAQTIKVERVVLNALASARTGSVVKLKALGVHCYVIAPRKLDEGCTRVKTDPRDATTLCQRLSRYVEGNTRELAVIRVPSEAEEQARYVSRQREQLVRHRQKLEAQGRSLLINHSLPAPAHWWKNQTWSRLSKLLPAWICLRLEVHRPVLLTLEQQISVLSAELEAAAPADVPAGVGKLTTVVMTREICSWERFRNRRAISSYTGLCPGEHSSGTKRVPGSVTKHGNPRLRAALVECAWRMVRFQPQYPPVKKRLSVLAKGARATGAQRKKAIVAVARHLAVDLWRVHTGRNTAVQLGLTI